MSEYAVWCFSLTSFTMDAYNSIPPIQLNKGKSGTDVNRTAKACRKIIPLRRRHGYGRNDAEPRRPGRERGRNDTRSRPSTRRSRHHAGAGTELQPQQWPGTAKEQ